MSEESELSSESPFGDAAVRTISGLSRQMMAKLAGTREGVDPEALHDMRVASRRLRAALKLFRSCFPPEEHAVVSAKVAEVTQALGCVRDQDVFIEFLKGRSEPLDWLIESETATRENGRVQMLAVLDRIEQEDLGAIISRLLLRASRTKPGRLKDAFGRQAPAFVQCRVDALEALAPALKDAAKVAELHQMRIAAKRLRYTMEIFIPCFGEPLVTCIAAVKLLQEQLGRIHDCDVWVGRLEAYEHSPDLSKIQKKALQALISDLNRVRQQTFDEAVVHWSALKKERFVARLLTLVKPTGKAGRQMEKKKQPKSPEAAEPEIQPAPAEKIEETPAGPDIGAATEQVRQGLAVALARVTGANGGGRLTKQLGKIEAMLAGLAAPPAEPDKDYAEKVTKWLGSMAGALTGIPESGKLSEKDCEKLRDKLRRLRRKIAARIGQ